MKAASTIRLKTVCRTFVITLSPYAHDRQRVIERAQKYAGHPALDMRKKYRYGGCDTAEDGSERDEWLIEKLVDRQVLPGGTYLTFVRDTIVTSDGVQRTRDIVLHRER